MAKISHIDGAARRIYLDAAAAVDGRLSFHPTDDLYAEYKGLRASDESVRPFDTMLVAGIKLGRKITELQAARVVVPDGVAIIDCTGDLTTSDGGDPFDTSLVTGPCVIRYQPIDGYKFSLADIAESVWDALADSYQEGGTMGNALATAPTVEEIADEIERIGGVLDITMRAAKSAEEQTL